MMYYGIKYNEEIILVGKQDGHYSWVYDGTEVPMMFGSHKKAVEFLEGLAVFDEQLHRFCVYAISEEEAQEFLVMKIKCTE